MSLKQSIVVKNEFTHNGVNTPGRGSRGGTPGQYVLRYMARIEASETITPVPDEPYASIFDYTTRYMLRSDATERLKDQSMTGVSIHALEHEFEAQDRLSGLSFGNKGISLGDNTVRESSDIIQNAFDEGHSVQKIILSFTEDYLKESGVLSPNFVHGGRGSYRGHIDQLKMRQAIIKGVDKMTTVGNYASPEWVGVIQVDTNHVHAHLALVDTEFSPLRMMDDGHDKGKLTQREMMDLRRGIHYELNEMKAIKGFHKQVSLERQNVVGYVKDYVNDHIMKNSRLQIIMASLPEEQRLWRYGSNRVEMQHANSLAEQYVTELFHEQPVRSGYREASRSIEQYIEGRVETEGISMDEQDRLRRNGESLLIERSVNGVYDAFGVFDKKALSTTTPMLDIQSSSEEELLGNHSDGFDEVGFELRVRGYSTRRDHHTKESIRYKTLLDNFEESVESDEVISEAYVLHQFYQEELEWHMGLTDKYRSFFRLNSGRDRERVWEYTDEYADLSERYDTLSSTLEFVSMVEFGTFDFDELDGIESTEDVFANPVVVDEQLYTRYGINQGSRVFSALYRDGVLDELAHEQKEYVKDLRDYTFNCYIDGVATLKEWTTLQPEHRDVDIYSYEESVSDWTQYVQPPNRPVEREVGITDAHFDSVKALDIHHLGVDYYVSVDRTISDKNIQRFTEAMQWREHNLAGAVDYLERTGQTRQIKSLESTMVDVQDMRDVAMKMSTDGLVPSVSVTDTDTVDVEPRNKNTFSIDVGVDVLSSMVAHLDLSDDDLMDLDHLEI